jgi:hypothetical protein
MPIANCSCVSTIVLSAKHCAAIHDAFLPLLLNAALSTKVVFGMDTDLRRFRKEWSLMID